MSEPASRMPPGLGLPVPDNFATGDLYGATYLDNCFHFIERQILYEDQVTNHLIHVGHSNHYVVGQNYQYRMKYTLYGLGRKVNCLRSGFCPNAAFDSPYQTYPEFTTRLEEGYLGPASLTMITANMDMDTAGPFRGTFTREAAIRQDHRCKVLGRSWLSEINKKWNATGPPYKMSTYESYALWESVLAPGTDGYINANYPGFVYVGEEEEFTDASISEDEDEEKKMDADPPSPPEFKRPPTPFPTPCASPGIASRSVQPTSLDFLDYFSYPGSNDDDYKNFKGAEEAINDVSSQVPSRPTQVVTPIPTPMPPPPPFSPTFNLAPQPVTVKAYHIIAKTTDPRSNRDGYSREDPIVVDEFASPTTPSPSSSNSSSDQEPKEPHLLPRFPHAGRHRSSYLQWRIRALLQEEVRCSYPNRSQGQVPLLTSP